MKSPPRLFEDPGVSTSLSDDLRVSRRVKAHYDTLAKLPQLRAALSAQGPVGAPRPAAQGARWNAARLKALPWTAKLAVLAAIGGTALGATVNPTPSPPRQSPPIVAAPTAAPIEAPWPVASTPPVAAPAPAPVQPVAPVAPAANKPRAARSASSRREVELLIRIRQLVERDPDRALRLAAQAEREFPSGALCEEREALQVLALARRGDREEAQRRAHDFLLRHPRSPMRARLQADLRKTP